MGNITIAINIKHLNVYTTAEGVVGCAWMTSSSFLAFGVITAVESLVGVS